MRCTTRLISTCATLAVASTLSLPARAVDEINVAYFLEWATPSLMAKAEKLYDDALGVNVNWVAFDAGTQMTEAMLAGDIDISYSLGLAPFITAINAGAPLLTVGVAVEYPASPCIVHSSEGVTAANAHELEGKTVAVPLSTMADYSFRMQMNTLDVDVSTMTIVDQVPADAMNSLINGDVAMACLWGGASVKKAKEHGEVLMSEAALMAADIITFDVISVTQKFAQENPDMVKAFMDVTNEINKEYGRTQVGLEVIARESGMDVDTTKNQMAGMIFPTAMDQIVIYFNKAGVAESAIEMVGRAFATPENPARTDYSSAIDTSYLLN